MINTVRCDSCGNSFDTNSPAAKVLTVYQNPFTVEFDDYHFCSEGCMEEYENHYRNYTYSYCPGCDKNIIANDSQANYFRFPYSPNSEEVDDIVCEACYEARIIEQGQPAIDFANSWLTGGLWADRISEHGRAALHEQYVTISDYCLDNEMTAARCNSQALAMIEQGHKVLMAYAGNGRSRNIKIVSIMIKR